MQTYKLLEQDTVLLSQPLLIEHFGRAGAQFLSQLHYWLEKKVDLGCNHRNSRWIYNSAESWAQQIQLSVTQVKRIIKKLRNHGVIQVQKLSTHKSNRTNYYSIDYDKLNASITTQKASETHGFVHSVIMTPSSYHNEPIYLDTKTTNKDFNKSEEIGLKRQVSEKKEQVKPVDNFNLKKLEKSLDTTNSEISSNLDTTIQALVVPLQKTSTSKDMLAIWNEVLGDKAQASMSKELAPLLVSAFAKKFDKNFNHWKTYCETIKSSRYLMGNQFFLSIFWSLKFGTIDRIRAGELGVKRHHVRLLGQGGDCTVLDDKQIAAKIEMLEETILAKNTRRKIVLAIGYCAYHSWFHQAKFIDCNGEIRLEAPNAFVESIWDRDYPWVSKGKLM